MIEADLAIVGGGPAGYAAALRGRELGATVALIEAHHLGGHCVHYACIPSTIMLDTARRVMETQEIALARVLADPGAASFHAATQRKSVLVHTLAQGIGALLRTRRVQILEGRARFRSATDLDVQLLDGGDQQVQAKAVILATGARYEPAPLAGIPANDQLTPDQALALDALPARALVVGDGPAGLGFAWEYASLFASFGAEVTLLEPASGPAGLDAALVDLLAEDLKGLGVTVLRESELVSAVGRPGAWEAEVRVAGEVRTIAAEVVIRPDARVPVSDLPGLGALGAVAPDGWVAVDAGCRTSVPGLFAAGDVTGPPLLSNVAERQGRVAAENALGGAAVVDLTAVPYVLHTEPELGGVGLTEAAARAEGYDVRVGLANLAGNGRAASAGRREGLVKVVADAADGGVLGVHMAVPFAAEAIAAAVLALRLGARLADLAEPLYWHPSIAEALSQAARAASR